MKVEIGAKGLLLQLDDGEVLRLPFAEFPWFRDATREQVENVERRGDTLRWPQLDVDLQLEAIREPARFPLVWKKGEEAVSTELSVEDLEAIRQLPEHEGGFVEIELLPERVQQAFWADHMAAQRPVVPGKGKLAYVGDWMMWRRQVLRRF